MSLSCNSAVLLKWVKHAVTATAKPLANLYFKRSVLLGAELNVGYAAVRICHHSTPNYTRITQNEVQIWGLEPCVEQEIIKNVS